MKRIMNRALIGGMISLCSFAHAGQWKECESFMPLRLSVLDQSARCMVASCVASNFIRISSNAAMVQVAFPAVRENGTLCNQYDTDRSGYCPMLFRISQAGNGDVYLANGNRYCVVIPGDSTKTEGVELHLWVRAEDPFEYTTVVGARRRIPKYVAVDAKVATPSEIFSHIKASNTVSCVVPIPKGCQKCRRTGKVPGTRTWDVPCPECDGDGLVYPLTPCSIAW